MPGPIRAKASIANSDVRLQWDPDHDPKGEPLTRRAIQLGLRGRILERFGQDEVVQIEDISDYVAEQREILSTDPDQLHTPEESVYFPKHEDAWQAIGLESSPSLGSEQVRL